MTATMEQAIKLVTDTLPVSCAYTSKITDDGNSFQLGYCSSVDIATQFKKGSSIKGEGVSAMLSRSEEEIVFGEEDHEIRNLVMLATDGLNIRSGVWMPIMDDDRQWGVLTVGCESSYDFSQKEIEFLRSVADIIALISRKSLIQKITSRKLENISLAKRQWEVAVDSLPQLVIALNQDAKIIRVNRTSETWGIGKVAEAKGLHISDYLRSIANAQASDLWITDWSYIWARIKITGIQSWLGEQSQNGRTFEFTLRRIVEREPYNNEEQCYAILVIDDITASQNTESSLKKRAVEMERLVKERTLELKHSNDRLEYELHVQKRDKEALKEAQKCRQDLLRELITAQEKERKRIACELHDSVGQSLGAVKFKVEELVGQKNKLLSEDENYQFNDVVDKLKHVIDEVRHIAMDLRPAMLDDLGIEATLNWFCRELNITYSGITIRKQIRVSENHLSDEMKVVIFRIVQEAMNNIVKHANATHIDIELEMLEPGIRLSIKDDGKGFNSAFLFNDKISICRFGLDTERCGFGLSSMCERAESSNGDFSLESIPGEGTCIRVLWDAP